MLLTVSQPDDTVAGKNSVKGSRDAVNVKQPADVVVFSSFLQCDIHQSRVLAPTLGLNVSVTTFSRDIRATQLPPLICFYERTTLPGRAELVSDRPAISIRLQDENMFSFALVYKRQLSLASDEVTFKYLPN